MVRRVAFLGPSWPAGRPIPAGVEVRPPARRGDVLRAFEEGATVIGLVDGELYGTLAPSPSELRTVAARIPVFGGGSLGALRALEVAEVEGVGEVFALFRSGQLEDEDEVVGTWDPERGTTEAWPMVVIREALGSTADPRLVQAIKAMPFHERTAAAIDALARHRGGRPPDWTLCQRGMNIKNRDAIAVVERLSSQRTGPA